MHPTASGHWIDFSAIPAQIGALSGGEQRLLRIAAVHRRPATPPSTSADCLAGLDRAHLQLVLAAVAHAAGSHEHQ